MKLLLPFISFLYSFTACASITFSLDDGSSESSLGAGGATLIWLNAFQASADLTLDTASIAFGGPIGIGNPPGNGTPVTVYFWSDPNDDGNPLDAVVESSVTGVISNFETDIFVDFAMTPFNVTNGDFFFVGFQSEDFAVARDTTTSAGQSYVFSNLDANPLDPNALGAISTSGTFDSVGLPGNALIRASGVVVPEPSSLILSLSALVLSFFTLRRIRRNA